MALQELHKASVEMNLNKLLKNPSMWILCPRVLISTRGKLIKPHLAKFHVNTGSCLISEPMKIKNLFFLSRQQAANFQIYKKLSDNFVLTHRE